jgi:hypothetical protein
MCAKIRAFGDTRLTVRLDAGRNDGIHRKSIAGVAVPVQATLNAMSTLSHLQPDGKLVRCMLHAVDGEIGMVEALYFDDVNWVVRYLLVNTGDWLAGRRVLISPVAVGEVREDKKIIFIELTRRQVENSPPLDATQTVSRDYETAYYRYYDWPVYWEDDRRGVPLSTAAREAQSSVGEAVNSGCQELRLHRTSRLDGCAIVTHDGVIGRSRGAIVDTRYWVIRYLAIETHHVCPGRYALVSPGWIERVNWRDHLMNIGLASTAIESAPGYDLYTGISRDYEARLFRHYGRRAYWQRNDGMN